MCDHWMPSIKLALTPEQYRQLPRHPGFKYEYLEGTAYLSPRSRHFHAMLDLKPLDVSDNVTMRPVRPEDFADLEDLFEAVFWNIQPFGSLDEETSKKAAQESLQRVRTGGDGPWIERASFVAVDDGKVIGAIFITLLPLTDPCDWDSYHWTESPPADCIEQRLGRPHLTWIFVDPAEAGRGSGTALLAATVRELLAMGYTQLLSTFMAGNDSSMLWHWRNGFQLLSHPSSRRLLRRRRQQRKT